MEEESAPAEPLATFSPAEWAALFPAPLRADDLPAELVPLVAKAADERAAAPPLGPADVSAALADAPVSRRLLHLQGFLGRAVLPRFALLRLAQQAFYVFFAALVWIENDGRFGTRQLVAATVARVVAQVIWDWRVLAGRFSSPDDREIFLDNEAVAAGADGSVLAGIVRYRLLERAGGSWLLEHVPGDTLCTCCGSRCSGNLIRRSLWMFAAMPLFLAILQLVMFNLLIVWTPLITFGAATWSTPWAATFSAVGLAVVSCALVVVPLAIRQHSVALFLLEARMHRRAVAKCLDSALGSFRIALEPLREGTWKARDAESRRPLRRARGTLAAGQGSRRLRPGRHSHGSPCRVGRAPYCLAGFLLHPGLQPGGGRVQHLPPGHARPKRGRGGQHLPPAHRGPLPLRRVLVPLHRDVRRRPRTFRGRCRGRHPRTDPFRLRGRGTAAPPGLRRPRHLRAREDGRGDAVHARGGAVEGTQGGGRGGDDRDGVPDPRSGKLMRLHTATERMFAPSSAPPCRQAFATAARGGTARPRRPPDTDADADEFRGRGRALLQALEHEHQVDCGGEQQADFSGRSVGRTRPDTKTCMPATDSRRCESRAAAGCGLVSHPMMHRMTERATGTAAEKAGPGASRGKSTTPLGLVGPRSSNRSPNSWR